MHLFNTFHILLSSAAAIAAAVPALRLSSRSEHERIRILAGTGWFLIALELYKQLYLTFFINGGNYDWWFFPFQLCSVPMYLCILLPHVKGRLRDAALTFMASYTFVGAVAALVYPEDFLLRPQMSLVLHGFIWHGALLFLSLLIVFSRMADLSWKGFERATLLFLCFCAAALCINIAVEPLMASAEGIRHIYAAMFYLNPYHLSPQLFVGTVQKSAGIPVGLTLYVCCIIFVSGLICRLFYALTKRS